MLFIAIGAIFLILLFQVISQPQYDYNYLILFCMIWGVYLIKFQIF